MHHSERVNDKIGRYIGHPAEAPALQQAQPRSSVWTGELSDTEPPPEPPGSCQSFHGFGGLKDQCLRLDATRLLDHRRFTQQLRQAARCTQPHAQRISRVWARLVAPWKVVTGWLFAQVERQAAIATRAGATDGSTVHAAVLTQVLGQPEVPVRKETHPGSRIPAADNGTSSEPEGVH